jgi:hypothetical protein
MLKRAVSFVLAVAFLPHLTGCTSVQAVDLTDVEHPRVEWIHGVITVTGERVDFDHNSDEVRNDTIYATVDGSPYAISLDQVQQLRLRRTDSALTALTVVGVIVGVVAGALALLSSAWPEGS